MFAKARYPSRFELQRGKTLANLWHGYPLILLQVSLVLLPALVKIYAHVSVLSFLERAAAF